MKYYTFGNFLRGIEDSKQIINQRIEDARIFYEKFYKNFEFRNCPICNGNDFSVMPKFLEIYEICRCNICNSVYSNLVPSNEALAWYYNNCKSNAMYADLNKTKKTQEKYMERVEFIIEQLRDYCGNTQNQEINILEVGCNNGALLSLLNDYLKKENLNKKIKIYGIDLDETVIAECKKQQIEGGGDFML
ncbi:methyltransferase [Helicobacter burdigaliensis]|uniref:methyltransferase n=1 Tax=Helicobacter burdigaliensis TaxID=2315334 RepID=UPI0039E97B00